MPLVVLESKSELEYVLLQLAPSYAVLGASHVYLYNDQTPYSNTSVKYLGYCTIGIVFAALRTDSKNIQGIWYFYKNNGSFHLTAFKEDGCSLYSYNYNEFYVKYQNTVSSCNLFDYVIIGI